MSVETVLARGRAAAERLMTDACVIRRKTGETTDPNSGVITPVYTTVYSGKCRVQQPNAQARMAEAGEAHILLLRLEVHLPVSVVGVQVADEVDVTTSADADLGTRVFLVHDLAHKTHATARRIGIEERTS